MMKVKVNKEASNVERKRRKSTRQKRRDETETRTQKAKVLAVDIRQEKMKLEDVDKRLEKIFGQGSRQELEGATAMDKIVERIEQLSKREAQFDKWEKMRQDFKETAGGSKVESLLEAEQDLPCPVWRR